MSTRRCLFFLCLLLLMGLTACGGGSSKLNLGSADDTGAPASLNTDELTRQLGLEEGPVEGLPPVPVDDFLPGDRGASSVVADGDLGSTRVVKGPDFFEAKKGLVQDGKLVLSSDAGVGLEGVDWAMYRVAGMYNATPETINLDCSAAEAGQSYFIGIADYSSMTWKWYGPATNTDGFFGFDLGDNEDRLTSKNGSMYFLLMTPEGNSASHDHTTVTPRTYGNHDCNCRPGCPLNVIASNGEFDNGVQVSWDEADAATDYEVVRDEIHGGLAHSKSCQGGNYGTHTYGGSWHHDSSKDSDKKYCKDNDDHDRDNVCNDEDDDDDNDGKKDKYDDDDDNDGKKDDVDDDDDNDGLCDKDDNDHDIPDDCAACINVRFECDKISVDSSKELVSVVLQFTDGVKQKFEGLSGLTGSFTGSGDNTGKEILKAWVKSGCSDSASGELFVPNYTYTNKTVVGTTTNLNFFDGTAESGKMYRYRVRAHNNKGWSKFCSSDCGWTSECDLTEDKCPTELTASDAADGAGVWLEWQGGGGAYDRFDIYRACSCFEVPVYEKIAETVNTAYYDETAECNKVYHYYVEKVCGSKTCKSNVDDGHWLCEGYCPFELSASDCEGDAVFITWEPGNGYGVFTVFRQEGDAIAILGITEDPEFVDDTAVCDLDYTYWVQKVVCGNPCDSNKDGGLRFCGDFCPSGLVASDDHEDDVEITWNPGDGSGTFEVLRKVKGGANFNTIGTVATGAVYVDTTAECDVRYVYQVRKTGPCSDPCVTNEEEGGKECCEYCPTSLVATDTDNECVYLTWDPGCVDDCFWIFRRKVGASSWTQLGDTCEPAWSDCTADCDVAYEYKVKKRNLQTGQECYSNVDQGKVQCCDYCPTNFTASDDQEDCVELNWTPGCDLPPGTDWHYKLQRKKVGTSTWTDLGMTQGSTFCDSTAECDVQYTYRVKRWSSGNDCFSDPDNGKLVCCDYCPTELTATIDQEDCVELNWNGGCPLPPDGFFKIQRKHTGQNDWTDLGMTTEWTYCDATAECNVDYTYRVKKWSSEGDCLSNQVPGKLVCCDFCPSDLVASDGTYNCGTLLTWEGGCGDGTFDIYRKLKGGTSGFKKVGWTTSSSFVDETGACNYHYIYKIKKYNDAGELCWTNEDEGWWKSN